MLSEDREEKPVLKATGKTGCKAKEEEVRRKDAGAEHRYAKAWLTYTEELQVSC